MSEELLEEVLLPVSPASSGVPSPSAGHPQFGPPQPHLLPSGAMLVTVPRRAGESLGLTFDAQMRLTYVAPGSAADQRGMRRGQQLVSVAGRTVNCFADVRSALAAFGDGDIDFVVFAEKGDELPKPADRAASEDGDEPGGYVTLPQEDFERQRAELQSLRRTASEAEDRARREARDEAALRDRLEAAERGVRVAARLAQLLLRARDEVAVARAEADVRQLEQLRASDLESFQADQAALKREMRSLREQLGDDAAAAASPPPDVLRAERDVERLRLEKEELLATVAERQELVRTVAAEVESAQAEAAAKAAAVATLRRQHRAADAVLFGLNEEYAALVDAVKQNAARQEKAMDAHNRAMRVIQQQARGEGQDRGRLLASTQDERDSALRKCEKLAVEREPLRKAHKVLSKQLQEARERTSTLSVCVDDLVQAVETARREKARMSQMEYESEALRKRLVHAQAEAGRLVERCEEADDDCRRRLALVDEKESALVRAAAETEDLRMSIESARQRNAALRKEGERAERLQGRVADEHLAALDAVDELRTLKEQLEAASEARAEKLRRGGMLQAELWAARSDAAARETDLEAALRQYQQELLDRSTDASIRLRKAEGMKNQLLREAKEVQSRVEKLQIAVAHAQATQASLAAAGPRRLSTRPVPTPTQTPTASARTAFLTGSPPPSGRHGSDPGIAHTPRGSVGGGAAVDYLQLSDENCRLLAQIAELKDRVWAAGESKRKAQKELLRMQEEIDKKRALMDLWEIPAPSQPPPSPSASRRSSQGSEPSRRPSMRAGAHDHVTRRMLHVAEELLWSNAKLTSKTKALQQELDGMHEQQQQPQETGD